MFNTIKERVSNLFNKPQIQKIPEIQEVENSIQPKIPVINKKIYIFSMPDDSRFDGQLKIGETKEDDVIDRIQDQFKLFKKTEHKMFNLEYSIDAIKDNGDSFSDHDIHNLLREKGFIQMGQEIFKCTLKDVKAIILTIQTGKANPEDRSEKFKMRPEQIQAVNMTSNYFKTNKNSKFLWNAKMRFGKTFTSYQLALEMEWKKILVVTFKPAVETEWKKDLNTHIDFEGWEFVSALNNETIPQNNPYVYFISLQNLNGTENDEIKEKNKWIFSNDWDCVIFDEYHFGAWRENTKELFEDNKEENTNGENLSDFNKISTKYQLFLSGTPFRAITSGEFNEDQIFNWTYPDEQKAKQNWDYNNGKNPYESLAQIHLMVYDIDDKIKDKILNTETNQFDLSTFFKANGKADETAKFINNVGKWLDVITGTDKQNSINDILDANKISYYPFENLDLRNQLQHTLWFLPNISSCYAMGNLLKQHSFFKDYEIKVAAGDNAGSGIKAVEPVRAAIRKHAKTIILSCGKLTTGVTIAEWTGIFMLRNITTPETYFQAAFRIQSPWIINENIIKHKCYIFDFAPDRALMQVNSYCEKMDPNGEKSPKEKLQEFINFMPIMVCNRNSMREINVEEIYSKLTTLIMSKKWDSPFLFNDSNIGKIDSNMRDILNTINGTKKGKDKNILGINESGCLEAVEGSSDNLPDRDESEEKQPLPKTDIKKLKEQLQLLMAKIPLYLYLSEKKENTLNDILNCNEPELFQQIVGISIGNFSQLVKLNIFNSNLITSMIYNFSIIEEESENYF